MVILNEMAQFKGFGVTIEVRSNDHGAIGKASEPAHAHVLDNSEKEIAQIVLTKDPPKKASDVVWYRTDNPPKGLNLAIVKLANSQSKVAKIMGTKELLWQDIIRQWLYFHGK